MKPEAREYMREIGRRGGRAKSERKTEACRRNAKQPRKHVANGQTIVANKIGHNQAALLD